MVPPEPHDPGDFGRTFENASLPPSIPPPPRPIDGGRTVAFGRGVSYMESQIQWHYWPMSDEQYEQALNEIESVRR